MADPMDCIKDVNRYDVLHGDKSPKTLTPKLFFPHFFRKLSNLFNIEKRYIPAFPLSRFAHIFKWFFQTLDR